MHTYIILASVNEFATILWVYIWVCILILCLCRSAEVLWGHRDDDWVPTKPFLETVLGLCDSHHSDRMFISLFYLLMSHLLFPLPSSIFIDSLLEKNSPEIAPLKSKIISSLYLSFVSAAELLLPQTDALIVIIREQKHIFLWNNHLIWVVLWVTSIHKCSYLNLNIFVMSIFFVWPFNLVEYCTWHPA